MSYRLVMLGERILTLRKKRGWSQRRRAEQVGTSDQVIGRYERGVLTPSVETAAKIAEALEVSLDYLVGSSEQMQLDKQMLERLEQLAQLASEDRVTVLRVVDALIRDARTRQAYAA